MKLIECDSRQNKAGGMDQDGFDYDYNTLDELGRAQKDSCPLLKIATLKTSCVPFSF